MRSAPSAAVLVCLALLAGCSSDRADTAEANGSSLSRRSAQPTGSTKPAPPTVAPTSPTGVTSGTSVTSATVPPSPDPSAKVLETATGVIVPVLGVTAGGYRVHTPCGREISLTGGRPLQQATVVLDPGHGGVETGSVGANGLVERDLNLEVARRVASLLERAGVSVVLTRTHDYRITIATRAEIALGLAPRAFVSIHHNGGSDGPSTKPGTETFFQIKSKESRRLAGLIQEELFATFATHRDIAWEADSDAGAKYRPNASGGDYYGILRRSSGVPTALSEALFLSNPPEAALLAMQETQQAEAEALARAIQRFLTTDDPGSGFVDPYPRTEPAGPGGGADNCQDPALE